MHKDPSSDMAALLPRLLRFAFVLGGSRSDAERVVESACKEAGRAAVYESAEPRLDRRMFSLVYELWSDRGAEVASSATASCNGDRGPIERIRCRTAELSTIERAALALVVVDGRSYSEAAAILSLEVRALSPLLHNARMRLVETL